MSYGSPIGLLLILTNPAPIGINYTEIISFDVELNKTVSLSVELNKVVSDDYSELESTT